jgi:hypothetical protein
MGYNRKNRYKHVVAVPYHRFANAAIRKPIIRDSLAAGFIGWFIGTILGIPVGYVSTVQIGTINIQPPSLEMGIVFAMVGGAFSFWGSFISAYFALVGKEKPASTRNRKQ